MICMTVLLLLCLSTKKQIALFRSIADVLMISRTMVFNQVGLLAERSQWVSISSPIMRA